MPYYSHCIAIAINTLKLKFVYIVFKSLARTSKRTPHFVHHYNDQLVKAVQGNP
jgi:hypothetical protein